LPYAAPPEGAQAGTPRSPARGLLITATDTGVGKTVLAAALTAALTADGLPVRAHKPVVTGLDEPVGAWPRDHELLASLCGLTPEEVSPLRFGPAVSPHLAAELAGEAIDPAELIRAARGAASARAEEARTAAADPARADADGEPILVVEGVGGLLVPFTEDFTVCDLAAELRLPVLIAARPGLGTINHTLLTLQAARAAGLDVLAVVLTPWPANASHAEPSQIERSNRNTIARLGEVDVLTLLRLTGPDIEALARAGETLPWRKWLGLG
jgi:dethiobiotin synthetase